MTASWYVVAWIPHPRDPYRYARGIASVVVASYADALAVADVWARSLAGDRRIVVEAFSAMQGECQVIDR